MALSTVSNGEGEFPFRMPLPVKDLGFGLSEPSCELARRSGKVV
jgi:hypothetical protein